MQELKINIIQDPRGIIAHMQGNADNNSTAELHKTLESIADQHRLIVLDMTELQYIASIFLSELISVRRQLQKANQAIHLVGACKSIREVFEKTRLVELFTFFDTVDQALDAGS